jgi:hypothetical protein
MKAKIQKIYTCFQCRYGDPGDSYSTSNGIIKTPNWCFEASREIPNINELPEWCPLEDADA